MFGVNLPNSSECMIFVASNTAIIMFLHSTLRIFGFALYTSARLIPGGVKWFPGINRKTRYRFSNRNLVQFCFLPYFCKQLNIKFYE